MRWGAGARVRTVVGLLVAAGGLAIVPATAAEPGNYVSLGDSYTAGPVIPLYAQPWGCLKSTNNFPNHLAPKIGLALRDPSCSGAETDDMTQEQGVTPGPNAPQFDSLDADTQVVTVQLGGNDIGFSGIAEDCFSPSPVAGSPCRDRYVVNGQDEVKRRIDETAPKVDGVIDIYAASVGHDACQPPGLRWIEPLVPAGPAAPVHPNLIGMLAMADVAAQVING
jgi:hypothetical protein